MSNDAEGAFCLRSHCFTAQGIGLATVKLFIEEGAKVVASDVVHLDAPAAAVAETLKSGKGTPFASNIEEVLLTVKCDVTKEDEVIALCEAAMSRFGQIDAAIFNAGLMSPPQPWVDCDAEVFDRVTAVNTRGPWLCTKHVVRSMRASPHGGKGGSLVYVSSQGGLEGTPTISSYGASKWAMRGLSLSAAQEFAEFGIVRGARRSYASPLAGLTLIAEVQRCLPWLDRHAFCSLSWSRQVSFRRCYYPAFDADQAS